MVTSTRTPSLDSLYSQITDVDLDVSQLLSKKITAISDALQDGTGADSVTRDQLLDLMASSTAQLFEHIHRLQGRSPEQAAKLAGWVNDDIEQLDADDQKSLISKMRKYRPRIMDLISAVESLIIIHDRVFSLPETSDAVEARSPKGDVVNPRNKAPKGSKKLKVRVTKNAWENLPSLEWQTLRRGQRLTLNGASRTHDSEVGVFLGRVMFESRAGAACGELSHDTQHEGRMTVVSSLEGCVVYSNKDIKYLKMSKDGSWNVTSAVMTYVKEMLKSKNANIAPLSAEGTVNILFAGSTGTRCRDRVTGFHTNMDRVAVRELISLLLSHISRD